MNRLVACWHIVKLLPESQVSSRALLTADKIYTPTRCVDTLSTITRFQAVTKRAFDLVLLPYILGQHNYAHR